MKVVTIVGARPQFIKAAFVSREFLIRNTNEVIIHTGQHYDHNMSGAFFEELSIPAPKYNLSIGSGTHANQTGSMMIEIEKVLLIEKPSVVIVYGDTNSTLAGALSAAKLNIPVVHVEAGLRSYNMSMPEEVNRVLVDHISSLLLTITPSSTLNLRREGITENVTYTGDLMYDVFSEKNRDAELQTVSAHLDRLLSSIGLDTSVEFILLTLHRQEITGDVKSFLRVLNILNKLEMPCLFPIHPRTKKLYSDDLTSFNNLYFIDPLPYSEMLQMTRQCKLVITDSGGLLREAFFLGKPAIIVRSETEFPEMLDNGDYFLVYNNFEKITEIISKISFLNQSYRTDFFGDGYAHKRIVDSIVEFVSNLEKEN